MSGSTDAGHAVIVGVTSRTGEAIARRLRRSGWTIEGTARSRARAEETLGGIDAEPFVSGAPSRAASLDLSDGESIEGFLSGRTGDVPATDLLVIAGAPFEETPLAEARMADFLEHAAAQAAGNTEEEAKAARKQARAEKRAARAALAALLHPRHHPQALATQTAHATTLAAHGAAPVPMPVDALLQQVQVLLHQVQVVLQDDVHLAEADYG